MAALIWRYNSVKTNLTIFDAARLIFFAKNVSKNTITTKNIVLPKSVDQVDKMIANLFSDDAIVQENESIKIINATDKSGVGKELERILVNMGANVVEVSTASQKEPVSRMQYYSSETYTLNKVSRLLHFPVSKLDKQPIANIVITIGEDYSL